MNIRLYDHEHKHLLMDKQYPDWYFSCENGIYEHTTCLEPYLGNGFYQEIFFEGVHIGFGNTRLRNTMLLDFESDFETIEMHFALKGHSTAMTDVTDRPISFSAHHHNIIYANGISGKMRWEQDNFQLCEINLSPKFFRRFLSPEDPILDRFRNAIENGSSCLLGKQHLPINHQMQQIIESMMGCQRTGVYKRMFLEAKVIELLLMQLEQFSLNPVLYTSIKKSDVEKIHAVREFILNNLDGVSTLVDLAHQVGTNEFILKKGFKEIFGTTVFGFWNDAKMDQAKHLLIDHDLNVGEVSERIGYRNQRHFSAAFKKKFGIVPSQFKKKRNLS